MVNLLGALPEITAVVLGGVGAWLLVSVPGPIADRLGVHPFALGRLVVGVHLGTNVAFVLLYVAGILVAGTPTLAGYGPIVNGLSIVTLYGVVVTSLLSAAGIYLDRSMPHSADRWRPDRLHYVMAVPLILTALLFGADYVYQRYRS